MDNATIIKQAFAQRLRGLREATGLTQQELGDKLGYSRGSISYYEKCERVPDIVFLDAASSFFGVSVNFLLGFSVNKKATNDDIGFRFGLSDKAIEQLDSMELFDYQDFISAFICHELFPKLCNCMAVYCTDMDYEKIPISMALDINEFRHYKITTVLMAILNDLQKHTISCFRRPFKDIEPDESVRIQYYESLLERTRDSASRMIEEHDAAEAEYIRRCEEDFKNWMLENEDEIRIRNAAQSYTKSIVSSDGDE